MAKFNLILKEKTLKAKNAFDKIKQNEVLSDEERKVIIELQNYILLNV